MSFMDLSFRNAGFVWMRNLTVYRKTYKINILPNFFEPVIYLVAMGIGLGAYITRDMEGVSYLQFIAPGLIVANAMNGASFETTYNLFVKMYFGKIYQAITATPVNLRDAMLGEALWAVTRGTIYGTIFAVVVAAFGLVSGWGSLLLLPLIVLTSALFASIGMLFSASIKVIDMYSFFYTLWMTPLFLFSGIFFPVSDFPVWGRALAWCTPLYHCVNLAKGVVLGRWSAGLWIDLAWILVVTLVLFTIAIRRMEKRLEV